jgi:hypothetical protein
MITFVSAFYVLDSKFTKEKYEKWFSNFLPNIKKFKMVIFCNNESYIFLKKYINDNIILVIYEMKDFYNYKYKDKWIKNHKKNTLLNTDDKNIHGMKSHKTSWKLNMLWSEKISFVKKAYNDKYFPETEWYGWCDIGYFRGTSYGDISHGQIKEWPNYNKIEQLDKEKVYYAMVRFDKNYINNLFKLVNTKNKNGLPRQPIPEDQWSIAGGFFVTCKKNIDWWFDMYDKKLTLYFDNNYLVKDDQIIIVDNIFSEISKFCLISETHRCDPWFVFQRFLL